jgi:hypothetical protein
MNGGKGITLTFIRPEKHKHIFISDKIHLGSKIRDTKRPTPAAPK